MTTALNQTSSTGLPVATSPPRIVNALATLELPVEGDNPVPVFTIEFDQDVVRGGGTFWVAHESSLGYSMAAGQVVFDGAFVKIELPWAASAGDSVGVMFSADAVLGLDGAPAISSSTGAVVRALDYVDTEAPIARRGDTLEQLPGAASVFFDEFLWLGTGSIVIRDQAGSVLEAFDVTDSSRVQVDERRLILERTVPLDLGHRYTIEVPEGAFLDHLSNTAATTIQVRTRPVEVYASTAGGAIEGGPLMEAIYGAWGNDTLIGGGEDDFLIGDAGDDTAAFRGHLSEYSIGIEVHRYGDALGVAPFVNDQVANRDGRDVFYDIEVLQFSDYTVQTGMLSWSPFSAHRHPEFAQLSQVSELYVGFFDRIPEAAGMLYWLDQLGKGVSLETIAERFHEAGTQFGLFGDGLSTEAYLAKVYDQVLGRGPSHAQAPTAIEIAYWRGLIDDGTFTRATVVLQMLRDVHDKFEDHPSYGWVANLLDNKVALANYYALEHGLGRHSAQEDIAFGQQLADLVTPDGYSQAIALIGLGENTI